MPPETASDITGIFLILSPGKLHPLLVHLPIGFLLAAAGIEWLGSRPKYQEVRAALPWLLAAGFVAALLSAITGWVLADMGSYEEELLFRHRWPGVTIVGISLVCWLSVSRPQMFISLPWVRPFSFILMTLALFWTGHQGGALTHGPDYLFQEAAEAPREPEFSFQSLPEAAVYADLVVPVLQARCVSCHGPSKQKGGLRLDAPEWIRKGGKNGPVIDSTAAGKSELIHRLLLPAEDEKHMPPSSRKQPGPAELALLQWWAASGSFTGTMAEKKAPDSLVRLFAAWVAEGDAATPMPPEDNLPSIPPVKAQILDSMGRYGLLVLPLSKQSSYLKIDFLNTRSSPDSLLSAMKMLQGHVVSMRLSGKGLTDTGMQRLAAFRQVRKLYLDHTRITDAGLRHLKELTELQYLNLTGTPVTLEGLRSLQGLKNLKAIYLFQSGIVPANWEELQSIFPGTHIDTGGYHLPLLPGDTSEVKKK